VLLSKKFKEQTKIITTKAFPIKWDMDQNSKYSIVLPCFQKVHLDKGLLQKNSIAFSLIHMINSSFQEFDWSSPKHILIKDTRTISPSTNAYDVKA